MQAIEPVEYEGVKAVSFGYAGQGSAIMRGPMVSGKNRHTRHWATAVGRVTSVTYYLPLAVSSSNFSLVVCSVSNAASVLAAISFKH